LGVAFASAIPLEDISTTTVDLYSLGSDGNGDESFAVAVQRTDDLLTDEGEFLAERITNVILGFDVKSTSEVKYQVRYYYCNTV